MLEMYPGACNVIRGDDKDVQKYSGISRSRFLFGAM